METSSICSEIEKVMKKKNLDALNNDELLEKQQFFKVVNYIFTAAVLFILASNIITTITKAFKHRA